MDKIDRLTSNPTWPEMTWNFCVVDSVSRLIRVRFDFSLLTAFLFPVTPRLLSSLPLTSTQQLPGNREEQKVGGVADHRLVVGWARSAHLIGSCPFFWPGACVVCPALHETFVSTVTSSPTHHPTLSISLNLFKNDGTVPTTTASEPRSSRVSRGDHHQSEPQSLPSRSCSAQLRTTASTTQPSSLFLFN